MAVDSGMIVEAEVCQLEPGRFEYETRWGGRKLRYYLPKGFSETEFGGHELGQHRLRVRIIRPTTYTANVGDIPYLTRSINLNPIQQVQEYERLLSTSAIFAMEKLKYTYWSSRATSVTTKVHLKQIFSSNFSSFHRT